MWDEFDAVGDDLDDLMLGLDADNQQLVLEAEFDAVGDDLDDLMLGLAGGSDEGGMSAGLGSDLNVGCEGDEFGGEGAFFGVDDDGELYEMIGEHDETPY